VSQHIERDPDKRIDSDRGTFDIENQGATGAERESGTAGLPRQDDVPRETIEEIERDRSERLDPAHRPDQAEVDNTGRTFDSEAGMFTDSEGYDEAERRFPAEDG
jgi:hypothetical protein